MLAKKYLQLARFPEAFLFSFFSVATSYLFASNGALHLDILIPVSAGIFGTAGMCALNDYYDFEADKLGAKNRPLPSGAISLKDGLSFAIILTITGMMITGLSDKILLPVIGGFAVITGMLYNWKTKGLGLWGTINFGLIMIMLVMIGVAQIDTNLLNSKYILLFCFVFFTAAGNQSTANFYDFKSDKIYGYRTIPNIYGLNIGAIIVLGIRIAGFILLVLILFNNNMLNVINSILLLIIALLILISHHFLSTAHETRNAAIAFKISIAITLLSFCAIVLGIYIKN